MAQKKDSKKNGPISINDLSIQDFENLAKQVNEKRNSTFYGLNQFYQDAEYTKEEILQMRESSDKKLYKSPAEVISSYSCIWENGKVGYFIPFEHKPLGGDFLPAQFGGGQKDGKGLRFVQKHKGNDLTLPLLSASNEIIISGFAVYVLEQWGSHLNELFESYTNRRYKKIAEQWRNENFPKKINQLVKLNILKLLRELEIKKWNEATITDFLSTTDSDKLKFCMEEFIDWLDKCLQFENKRDEMEYVKNIQLQKVTVGNGWANGKSGQFNDFDNNYQYRFCETDENGYHYLLNDEEQRKLPVLACGFVAWLIKHWGTDTQTIYSGYLQARLDQYKSSHKNDADVLKRNLDSEFFEQYNSQEEKFVLQSEAIFDFVSDDDVKKIKNYISNYFDFIGKYLPYKIYNSFDQAIRECNIEDKILLHSITKFLNPSYRLPINIFNDILMIRATHLTEPSKCRNFIRDNYNNTSQEYIILIHILKNTLDRNCDLQLLLPDISIKKDLTDVYDNLQNSIRKNLTVHFDILRGALLIDKSDSSKIYTTINITDEIALHFLSTQPETRKHFYLLPPNVDELIEEYKSKHSKKKNNNFPVKTKGQKTANKNKSFTEPINVFSKFLQITNPDTIKSIVEIISSDLKVSKSPNLSVALFTVALQRKCYLSSVLNKTQYHKALVGLFGEKAGTRAKFNEKFNEIIQELYVTNLDEYIKRLP